MSHKTGKYMECEECGKKIYVSGWRLKAHKYYFCSEKCYQLWQKGNLYGKSIKQMQEHNRIFGVWNKGLTKEIDRRLKIIGRNILKTRKKKGSYISNSGSFKKGNIPKNPIKKGEHRSSITEFKKGHKLWEDLEFKEKTIKAILKGLMKRPTSFEKKISELCIENSLPFIYTGDGRFLINFKNPDFVNHQDKVVIEVFYSWFKIRDYGSVEKYKEFCRKKYNPTGWKVIFIDENEVDVDNWKELCLNKIINKNG